MRAPKRAEPRRRRASRHRPRPFLGIALVVLGFAISGMSGAGAYFLPVFAAAFQTTGQKVDVRAHPSAAASAPALPAQQTQAVGSAFTVLLLGSDNDQKPESGGPVGRPLTQSMILVRVNPATRKVVMLSIPRDLYVPIYTAGGNVAGSQKIDVAYSWGQEQEAIATVENNFNVKVDEYVWIGLKGLINLIDRMGGVDVITTNPVMDDLYPNDINTSNPYGYHRLAIDPGPQHMNGMQAMEYVRSRHSDIRQDFGRSFRQQQVLVALRSKAKNLSPTDLPDLAASFQGQLKTSLNLSDVSRLRSLLSLASQIQTSNITQVVMVNGYTSDLKVGQEMALRPNWPAIHNLVHKYFPPAA
jgi:LCP family protein required for cell wall assembly